MTLEAGTVAAPRFLPRGQTLPEADWHARHNGILLLLWVHAAAIPGFALFRGYSLTHAILEGAIVPAAAFAASWTKLARRARTAAASVGLLSSSAVLVHLSGGVIETHFHFFVMVTVVALYHDWLPFLSSVAYVFVHHGLLGALDPESVFNHFAALNHPWRWAAIHAGFIAAISAVCLVTWRLTERVLDEHRRAEALLLESYERERTTALALQHSLLPPLIPAVATVRLAWAYRPAGTHIEVGGDWYDVLLLPDEALALTVGDVAGHDLLAAAVMGQLRSVIRIAALEADGPSDALARVDRYMVAAGLRVMTTVAQAHYSTASRTFTYALAGHPPPVLIRPGGVALLLDGDPLPPLGAGLIAHSPDGRDRRIDLEPGDTVVMYTDGLVERRGTPLDQSLAELLAVASASTTQCPEDLCSYLIDEMLSGQPPADDVALLVMAVDPLPTA